MAIITCPECGKEVSDKAASCPGCGAPQAVVVSQEPAEAQPPVEKEEKMLCPKCYSSELTSDKKGFSAGKALVGGLLVGPVGLIGGALGAKKLVIYCVACGHKFKPGQHVTHKPTKQEKREDAKNFVSLLAGVAVWVLLALGLGEISTFQSNHLAGWIGFVTGMSVTVWLLVKWK